MIDAGMVGTEMLYWLVGSRELDGGLMCTASHNPKAYTGAKLVQARRDRAVRRRGDPGHPPRDRGRAAEPGAAGGGTDEVVDIWSKFQNAALAFIDPRRDQAAEGRRSTAATAWPGRWSARCSAPDARPRRDLLGRRRRRSPTTSPTRCCPRTASSSSTRSSSEGADLGIAWDGDADRCFFIDDTGAFVDGDFLTALLAESLLAQGARRDDPLRRARLAGASRDTVERPAARALINRVGHAFFKTRMREEGAVFGGEVSGHYYFRDFYCADSGTIPALLILELLSTSGKTPERAARALPLDATSSPARSTPRSTTRRRRWRRSRRATRTGATISNLDGICVDFDDWHFNVRAVEHRAAAAPVPRVARLARRTWSGGATRCSR